MSSTMEPDVALAHLLSSRAKRMRNSICKRTYLMAEIIKPTGRVQFSGFKKKAQQSIDHLDTWETLTNDEPLIIGKGVWKEPNYRKQFYGISEAKGRKRSRRGWRGGISRKGKPFAIYLIRLEKVYVSFRLLIIHYIDDEPTNGLCSDCFGMQWMSSSVEFS